MREPGKKPESMSNLKNMLFCACGQARTTVIARIVWSETWDRAKFFSSLHVIYAFRFSESEKYLLAAYLQGVAGI